jgi:hypothetical protein
MRTDDHVFMVGITIGDTRRFFVLRIDLKPH